MTEIEVETNLEVALEMEVEGGLDKGDREESDPGITTLFDACNGFS